MTIARQLAAFLTAAKTADLPAQAMDYAAMVIASTLASAASGTEIESAQIIRALARESRYRQGACVVIVTLDGRTVSNTVFEPKGSAALGISWHDVDAKCRALMPASGLPEQKIEACLILIHDFQKLGDVSQFTDVLRMATTDP